MFVGFKTDCTHIVGTTRCQYSTTYPKQSFIKLLYTSNFDLTCVRIYFTALLSSLSLIFKNRGLSYQFSMTQGTVTIILI